jgi:hypothetical protein
MVTLSILVILVVQPLTLVILVALQTLHVVILVEHHPVILV